VILGFRRGVDGICAVLEYYAAYSGNSVKTFRDNLSDPFGRVRKFKTWISGSLCNVGEICALVGYCAVYSGNSLPTFRDISVPSSRVKNPDLEDGISWPLNMGPICCPETSVINRHCTLRNFAEEGRTQVFDFLPQDFVNCWAK